MDKRRRKLAATATVASLTILTLYYFYRWNNYWDRPLFCNVYSANRDGVGPWRWYLTPILFDHAGQAWLFDFKANMVAVVRLDKGRSSVIMFKKVDSTAIDVVLGQKSIRIARITNTLVIVDSSGMKFNRRLITDESETIHRDKILESQGLRGIVKP